jgi:hypothetical protein
MERLCTCVPHAHPGEASSDACFRWTAGPDTRLLLIAALSLERTILRLARATNMAAARASEGLCNRLDLTCSSLVIHPSIHPSVNQSINRRRKEEKWQWECDEMPDGRLINTTTGHERGCGEYSTLYNTRHAILSTSYMTQNMRCSIRDTPTIRHRTMRYTTG